MLRKVLSVRFMQSRYSRQGYGSNGFSLECGHQEFARASYGRPERKFCRACANLKRGGSSTQGNTRETWDAEKQLPKREVITA